jgi:hypothetical protein
MHVEPFGKAWAVVEGLGVISTHRKRKEAAAAAALLRQARKAQRPAP